MDKGDTRTIVVSEELLDTISDWLKEYNNTDSHDNEFNMELKDWAYSLFDRLLNEMDKTDDI